MVYSPPVRSRCQQSNAYQRPKRPTHSKPYSSGRTNYRDMRHYKEHVWWFNPHRYYATTRDKRRRHRKSKHKCPPRYLFNHPPSTYNFCSKFFTKIRSEIVYFMFYTIFITRISSAPSQAPSPFLCPSSYPGSSPNCTSKLAQATDPDLAAGNVPPPISNNNNNNKNHRK